MKKIIDYFIVWNPGYLGGAADSATNKFEKAIRNLLLYFGVAVGVFGQVLFDVESSINSWGNVTSISIARSFLIAAVILPVLYTSANLNRRKPQFIHFFICVQHGYFWPSIMASIGRAL